MNLRLVDSLVADAYAANRPEVPGKGAASQ